MMHAYRLVHMIEANSEALASSLLEKIRHSDFTPSYDPHVPEEELRQRVFDVYRNLGDWLLGKTELDVERRYREIGAQRYRQQVPLSELIWAIVLTKETLWQYLAWENTPGRAEEVYGELEVLQLVGQFFDHAVYSAAVGYEQARVAEPAAA
jgi:hypothetical protein